MGSAGLWLEPENSHCVPRRLRGRDARAHDLPTLHNESTTRMRLSTPSVRLVSSIVAALAFAGCAHPSQSGSAALDRGSYDVVIENGRVVDGTGNPWTYGDVGIRGERIAAITPRGG